MSLPSQRNSTRPKKVPKYLQFEEAEYGIYSGGRNNDGRELRTNAQENSQLAKLLSKFVQCANQKMRDYLTQDTHPTQSNKQSQLSKNDKMSDLLSRSKDVRGSMSQGMLSKKVEEVHADNLKLNSKVIDKKIGISKKPASSNISSTIQSDLSYHTMLGQLIKSSLPDLNHLSPQKLMQLNLPYSLLEQQNLIRLQTDNKDKQKKKKEFNIVQIKGPGKEVKEEMKPFKRQSYHVAIAYHIHLKQLHTGNHASAKDIDPTYKARKLRQQSGPSF